jgi:hypothetical protein
MKRMKAGAAALSMVGMLDAHESHATFPALPGCLERVIHTHGG